MYNMEMKHQPILEALKQQIEMEKNLSYGDSFNFFGSLFGNLLGVGEIKKELDEKEKKV